MKNGVSAVLITRNEAPLIRRCLESLGGLDQVVVYDTGSSDLTPDIARSMGADVHVGVPEIPFHFGNARNAALALARHDWVLSIDADEVLRAHLRPAGLQNNIAGKGARELDDLSGRAHVQAEGVRERDRGLGRVVRTAGCPDLPGRAGGRNVSKISLRIITIIIYAENIGVAAEVFAAGRREAAPAETGTDTLHKTL